MKSMRSRTSSGKFATMKLPISIIAALPSYRSAWLSCQLDDA